MPIIHVDLLEGRSVEVKRAYVKAVTNCTVEILKCKPEAVTVILSEMSPENLGQAGKLKLDLTAEEAKEEQNDNYTHSLR
jgi:4-oxalocrotonate tautomerase